jgi:hypothetical protein
VFIRYGLKEFNGEEIFESFVDDEWLSTKFMSYFVACLSHDESIHMAEGAGYRVFLSPEIGVSPHEWHLNYSSAQPIT